MTRHAITNVLAALAVMVIAVALVALGNALLANTDHWGDLTTVTFGAGLLIAWPLASILITPRRHR